MLRSSPIFFLVTMSLLAGCLGSGGGKDDTGDSGAAPGEDTGGGDGGGDGGGGTDGLTELSDPCEGIGPIYALHIDSAEEAWIGCGNGAGLWTSRDRGDSWSAGHPSEDLYVFDIRRDTEGRLLVCGHDYDPTYENVLVRRLGSDGEWEELLWYGTDADAGNQVSMSNCGQAVADASGNLLVMSNTIGDMARSTDDGQRWTAAERYWEEANLDDGGYGAYQLMRVEATSAGIFASGSTISQPPFFFTPSAHPDADWYNLKVNTVSEDVTGEGWALATPDEGRSWFVGGRDQSTSSAASGFLFRSDDDGASWESMVLGDEIDIVRDVAFSADGNLGIAVGDRYPPASLGGFALVTSDGGLTWTELNEDLPENLQRAAVEGTTWMIGGDGYLARGSF